MDVCGGGRPWLECIRLSPQRITSPASQKAFLQRKIIFQSTLSFHFVLVAKLTAKVSLGDSPLRYGYLRPSCF